jgi:hypothetical protein
MKHWIDYEYLPDLKAGRFDPENGTSPWTSFEGPMKDDYEEMKASYFKSLLFWMEAERGKH